MDEHLNPCLRLLEQLLREISVAPGWPDGVLGAAREALDGLGAEEGIRPRQLEELTKRLRADAFEHSAQGERAVDLPDSAPFVPDDILLVTGLMRHITTIARDRVLSVRVPR